MAPARNILLVALNIIFLLTGFALIGLGIIFPVNGVSIIFGGNFLLSTGVVVSLISVVGLIHSCCTNSCMLTFYVICMCFMISLLIFSAFVAFMVTNIHSADKFLSGNTVPGPRDDSDLLQDHLRAEKVWLHFTKYLVDAQFCNSLASNHDFPEFLNRNISPLQGVCCMPPRECGFEHKNGTLMWTGAVRKGEKNNDCRTWSNNQNELCLKCDTCKAGFLPVFRKQWRIMSFLLLAGAAPVFWGP